MPLTGVSNSIGTASCIPRRVESKVKLFEVGVVGTTHMTPPIRRIVAAIEAHTRISSARKRLYHVSKPMDYFFNVFSIFAQVSFSVTVRLKTRASGFESRSTQKYPIRSN